MKAYKAKYQFGKNEYITYTRGVIVICQNIEDVKTEVEKKFKKLVGEHKNYSMPEILDIEEISISDISLANLTVEDLFKLLLN